MKNNTGNPFTHKHEPFGFLVQSQGNGCYMVLRRTDEGWKRAIENVSSYLAACDLADRVAALEAADSSSV